MHSLAPRADNGEPHADAAPAGERWLCARPRAPEEAASSQPAAPCWLHGLPATFYAPTPTYPPIHPRPIHSQASKEQAVRWEARWLGKYDYAWNAVNNGPKRMLMLRQRWACFCIDAGTEPVEVPRATAPGVSKPAGGRGSAPRGKAQQRQQQQFVVSAHAVAASARPTGRAY
jgi:hypothetical protein